MTIFKLGTMSVNAIREKRRMIGTLILPLDRVYHSPSKSLPFLPKERSAYCSSSSVSSSTTKRIEALSSMTSNPPSSIIIMGAGIAGLCTAHYLLHFSSKPIHVTIIDANAPFSTSLQSNINKHENKRHTPSQKNGYLLVPSSYKSWMFQPLVWGKDSFLVEWIMKKYENKNKHDAITMDWRILGDLHLWKFGYHFLRQKYIRYKNKHMFDSNIYLQQFMQYSMSALLDPSDPILSALSYNRIAKGSIHDIQQKTIKREDSNGDVGLFCDGLYRELMKVYGKQNKTKNGNRDNSFLESCMEENIVGLEVDGKKVCAVKTLDKNNQIKIRQADAFIIALGTESTNICNTISVPCPIYPVKGYLLTISSNINLSCHGEDGNDGNLYNYKLPNMSYASPIGGGKWRISGCADFMPWPKTSSKLKPASELDSKRVDTLLYSARAIFSDLQLLDVSCCYRPVSADDMPLLGPTTKYPNLYLCTGHGSKGWTMGCASGKLLAQEVLCLEKTAEDLTIEPLLPSRFDSNIF